MMPEHEIHHRGQIYTMLGMLNVPTPPLYGMTAPQVQARAAHSKPVHSSIIFVTFAGVRDFMTSGRENRFRSARCA